MNNPIIPSNRKKIELDKKLKQIQSDELRLKKLEQELIVLQSRVAAEAMPIIEEFCEIRFENLTRMQKHLSDSFFKKKEKRLIHYLIKDLALGLQNMGDDRAETFFESSADSEKLNTEENEEEVEYEKFRPAPNPANLIEGNLEIKNLFRQLAKVFHPDREPLEHLKDEKTDLMKKITAAYENQDLYGLLKLEKEHLGPREFSEDKIELYIKHINDRLKEIKLFEGSLKKHGPLASVYKMIYSQKITIQEYNIKNELSKLEKEVQREKEFQQVIWDSLSLRNFLKT